MESSDRRPSRPQSRQSIAHIPSSLRLNGNNKQNATIDLSASRHAQHAASRTKKRIRGKSIGPGGLEALTETDGNATKMAPTTLPRSILKPAIPLTPPKNIPTFDELRQRSTKRKSPANNGAEALLIDFSTPAPMRDNTFKVGDTRASNLFDPFSPVKSTNLVDNNHTSDENKADEEERKRQEQKKLIMDQRAARRKSMANRRVSFAPEATLHTWSVMEMVEDSTTSSASNSTRRQSSMTVQQTQQRDTHSPTDEENTLKFPPISAVESEITQIEASPLPSNESKKKQSRRNSAISDDGDGTGDEIYSSSPSGDIATESSPIRVEDSADSDSDTDGDTAMSLDETTQNTVASQGSESSTHSSLEERLRQAASQAGTKGIEYDEYGDDMSMMLANDTVTNAFQPWQREHQQGGAHEQEFEDAVSPPKQVEQIVAYPEIDQDEHDTEDMTMEMTRAIGGIVGPDASSQKYTRKSAISRRRSSMGRRRSVAADSSYGDESMDLTTVMGGIVVPDTHLNNDIENTESDPSNEEDVTMDFTGVVGGFKPSRRESFQSAVSDENESMDMTAAVGKILPPIEEQTESQLDLEDEKTTTMAMDMTRAIGEILSQDLDKTGETPDLKPAIDDSRAEGSITESTSNISSNVIEGTPQQFKSVASETGSPSLALKTRSSGRTRSARISQASTPISSRKNSPQKILSVKKQMTPTKQLTPVPTRSKTPERTPLSSNVTHRGSSPRRLFQAEIRAKASPASGRKYSGKQQDPLFAQDELTGRQTPRVVLHAPKPHQHLRRRSSGIGIDKEGMGSPSVTQLLARRSSIGDAAPLFRLEMSNPPKIRFENPRHIADEIDAERAEDNRRESGRYIMEQEANEQQEENATLQLKDMIESMSPKKSSINKFKGRKSLAVGSARGILGKRPMELDEEEEDVDITPKRLKAVSREGSPVKKIHLPKPPSKEETTGRLTRTEQKGLESAVDGIETPVSARSPSRLASIKSPQQMARYKDVTPRNNDRRPTSFEEKLDNVICALDPSIEHPPASKEVAEEDKISLQQFLNMTNIHFIELNTTKRRQTLANQPTGDLSGSEGQAETIKTCFIAAATTMPLLELYQHATRELKSYIATGRKIIRSIESETLTEQPALFREYVEARPDIKIVMDNQFRNGKTHARLQSKEGWYTWRSQLVDGLQSGLRSICTDIENDLIIIDEQAEALTTAADELVLRHETLANDLSALQQRANDIESVDYQALKSARQNLQSADKDLDDKLAMLEVLKRQMNDKEETLLQAADLKDEMHAQIAEADRVREEQRGWVAKDVLALKAKVNSIEYQSGWTLLSAEDDSESNYDFGVALTLSYRKALRLFFHPSAFEQSTATRRRSSRTSHSASEPTAPISLTYMHIQHESAPISQLSTEQRFFLQLIRSQLHALSMMPKGSTAAKTILDITSSGWDTGIRVCEEVRLLSMAGIIRVNIQSDENLGVKLMMLLGDKGRIDIDFTLLATALGGGSMSVSTSVTATPIYGPVVDILNASKTRKVHIALNKEIESLPLGSGAWAHAVRGFEQWYQKQALCQNSTETKPLTAVASLAEPAPVGSTSPRSPIPIPSRTPAVKRSPLAAKRSAMIQKKIPVPTSRQDKFRTSQREPPGQLEKTQPIVQELAKDKENMDPFTYRDTTKPPAITPEMQEAMMQRTPVKRIGALRRSPI